MENYEKLLDELNQICEDYAKDMTHIGRKRELPGIKNLLYKLAQESYNFPGDLYIQEKIDDIKIQCDILAWPKKMTHEEKQHIAWLYQALSSTKKAFELGEKT